jgi:hypothetical protein
VLRIASENFRLAIPLLTQTARIQEINALISITPEFVAMARESLVIGTQ